MKLQPVPILLSMVFAAVVLFGGWFLYQNAAVASPLQSTVESIEGIRHVSTQVNGDHVNVAMELERDASLRAVMKEIRERNADLLKTRDLNIKIENSGSRVLDEWWSKSLFDIAEAMENKKYGDIPKLLNERKEELAGLQVHTEMDEQHVYVRLTLGDDSKFVMLPRTPAVMGVWTNETVR